MLPCAQAEGAAATIGVVAGCSPLPDALVCAQAAGPAMMTGVVVGCGPNALVCCASCKPWPLFCKQHHHLSWNSWCAAPVAQPAPSSLRVIVFFLSHGSNHHDPYNAAMQFATAAREDAKTVIAAGLESDFLCRKFGQLLDLEPHAQQVRRRKHVASAVAS